VLLLAALCSWVPARAAMPELDRDCVLELAEQADGSMTLAELRQACVAVATPADGDPAGQGIAGASVAEAAEIGEPGLVEQRLEADRRAASRPFSIMAHRPNYFLAAAYNTEDWQPAAANDNLESQFQVSLKVPLAVGLFGDRLDLYGAYTNRSFWQVYDRENSEPFRETNHEPEIWLQSRNDWNILGFTNSVNTVGWVHQSNGRSGSFSRSWDRVYATFVFERANWALAFKPWFWISQNRAESDNPDIDEYMGHGEFRAVYGRNGHVVSAMLRNQLESGFDRGALELSWSFPVFDYPYLRGYVQYFNGYGESLIDYDNKVNRLGIGISVTDWLE
jgi:phospholipase A1